MDSETRMDSRLRGNKRLKIKDAEQGIKSVIPAKAGYLLG